MANLAGMTPVQLDYFVRIGAVAPDLGDQRKHYSIFEAALVLIAGQLMPHLKDQQLIPQIIQWIRNNLKVDGVTAGSLFEMDLLVQHEEIRGSTRMPSDQFMQEAFARLYIVELGFLCDVPCPTSFMRTYCENEGLDFSHEIAAAEGRYRLLFSEEKRFPKFHKLVLKLSFFLAVIGKEEHFLQVATSANGDPEIVIDFEPVPMPGVGSWLTISLRQLFARLHPFIGPDFVYRATDYLKEHAGT